MKALNKYLISKKNNDKHQYHPKSKAELIRVIANLLNKGITNLNCIDVSKIDDMGYLFYLVNKKVNFSDINISEWDVSNVKLMDYMFNKCTTFNSDLSSWDVSNVENMSCMFWGCKKFNADLSSWDVHNVKYMIGMFNKCENFNSDLSSWDVSNVENMSCMFYRCKKFNADISKWDVSNVKWMRFMFKNCKSLSSIPDWYKEK